MYNFGLKLGSKDIYYTEEILQYYTDGIFQYVGGLFQMKLYDQFFNVVKKFRQLFSGGPARNSDVSGSITAEILIIVSYTSILRMIRKLYVDKYSLFPSFWQIIAEKPVGDANPAGFVPSTESTGLLRADWRCRLNRQGFSCRICTVD